MRKKTLFKAELLKQVLRQTGWVSIAYFIALFFILPFQVLRRTGEDGIGYPVYPESLPEGMNPLFDYGYGLQYPFVLLAPLLMGIFLFRYLQNKGYSDFLHSLPMKRVQLFLIHIGTGVLLLAVPLLLNALLLGLLLTTGDATILYEWNDIGEWTGVLLLFSLLIYSVSVFVGMLTGMSLLQGIVAFIFLVLPEALMTLVTSNLVFYFEGFTPSYYMSAFSQEYSPVIQMFSANLGSVPGMVLMFYGIATLLFLLGAYSLYRIRPLEMAGQAVSFPKAAPVFQYLIIFCFMLVGGIFFASGPWDTWEWLIFGYVVGSLFGFLVTEMLLEKTWRIFSLRTIRNYVVFAGISAIVVFVVQLDLFGYEERLPELEDIESVYIGDHNYRSTSSATMGENMTETENILRVMNVHKYLVEHTSGNKEGRSLFLEYELEDGERVARSYVLPPGFNREDYLQEVYESREYKEMSSPIFRTGPEDVKSVEFHGGEGTSYEISDAAEIEAFYEHMREDIYSRSYSQMTSPRLLGSDVILHMKGTGLSAQADTERFQVSLYDENTAAWMKEEGFYDQVFTDIEDVEELKIVTFDQVPEGDYYEEFRTRADDGEGVETISDPDEIREILSSSLFPAPAERMVGIYFKQSQSYPMDIYGLEE
ncbi:DUF6449 domain-containing protein [Salimicrobium halophilum]|uniref:ABC-2 type transport system permease protein n=1 Tax=Salimicrobium halophilum TaxID=86666 RepID=A0A1G8WQ79_9BACI|nr:DUF6449 domain-containing protein [Salimicrobium halophilum]SDJ80246.1 ABC-2 type transport system permease protein [Salimicrobium halophilum]